MNVIQNLVSAGKYGTKCPYAMNPTRIVVHNTANDAPAKNEIAYMISNGNEVSFHFAVDDMEVVQGVPLDRNAWHAGDGGSGTGNRQGIGIEICYSKSGGERFINAEKNAAKFIAQLLKERNWGIDKVTKHQDYSGKYCPHRTLDMGWERFLNMIKAEMNGSSSAESGTGDESCNGFVEVTYGGADGIDIHETPTFNGNVSCVAKKGEVFTVVGKTKVDGVYMYKLKSGLYITSASEYVSFRTTLHGSAAEEPKKDTSISIGDTVVLSTNATVYKHASNGVKIPTSLKGKKYTIQQIDGDCVLLKELVSWVLKSECYK